MDLKAWRGADSDVSALPGSTVLIFWVNFIQVNYSNGSNYYSYGPVFFLSPSYAKLSIFFLSMIFPIGSLYLALGPIHIFSNPLHHRMVPSNCFSLHSCYSVSSLLFERQFRISYFLWIRALKFTGLHASWHDIPQCKTCYDCFVFISISLKWSCCCKYCWVICTQRPLLLVFQQLHSAINLKSFMLSNANQLII